MDKKNLEVKRQKAIKRQKEKDREIEKKNKSDKILAFISLLFMIVSLISELTGNTDIIIPPLVFFTFFLTSIFEYKIPRQARKKDKVIIEYKNDIKRKWLLEEFNKYFTLVSVDFDKGIHYKELSKYDIITTGDYFTSNDRIVAKYKNMNFEMNDILIIYRVKSGEEEVTKTTFKGQWYIFDWKKTNTNLEIYSKNYFPNIMMLWIPKTHKVKTESELFNSKFEIWAEDEQDMFYILTPKIMERLMKLCEKSNCGIIFAIKDGKLHLGISNDKDLFEVDINQEVDSLENQKQIAEEVKLVKDLIEYLELEKCGSNFYKKI